MNDDKIIVLKDVTKKFNGDFTAVDNMNLYIRKGEFVTLLGPSGCGKTTTLRMIAGFEIPTEGQVLFNGEDITNLPPHLRKVNTVFQRYALFPHLNVYNNIAFGLKLKKMSKEDIDKKVKRALKIVGLADYEDRDVNSLSGGQQQRVAIARAIVNEPEVLLLDEPLGALDLKMRKDMQIELKEMHKKLGITFIYVTHDQEEALTMSDTIVVMRDGVIQQIGTPTDIYNEPKNAFVADFIGESNIIDGVMKEDYLVEFDGITVKCTDAGFDKDEAVDVVIRPEDFYITDRTDKAPIAGKIVSSVFKGVHYEMQIETTGGSELMVQDTKFRKVGDEVSLFIDADDIHIMKKMHTENNFEGVMVDNDTVEFLGGEYEVDGKQLVKGAKRNKEGELVDKNGEAIDLSGKKVNVSVSFRSVDLTDYEEDAPVCGEVMTIIFKANHYQYGIKADNGEFIYVDTNEQWDDGDRVGIAINKKDIVLKEIKEAE